MIVVVMGVTGSGKTAVGRALAARLGWRFVDADDHHSPENVAKMAAGTPLTDADREPWLRALREVIEEAVAGGESIVLACSALRRSFRERLGEGAGDVRYVYLRADRHTIARRLASRRGHFMNPALIESQFAALEPPTDAIEVDAREPVDLLVDRLRVALAL